MAMFASDAWREHIEENGFVPDSIWDHITGAVNGSGWRGNTGDGEREWVTAFTAAWLREIADAVIDADLDAGDCANVWCLMRCEPVRVLILLKRHGDLREFGATDSELDAVANPALALSELGVE